MSMRFKRADIMSITHKLMAINNGKAAYLVSQTDGIPSVEVVESICEKARRGNEMAAVQIFEWYSRYTSSASGQTANQKVLQLIEDAVRTLYT